ncbi:MAG TPA: hypothetical protein PKE26_13135 [Kiritimatiellia bacterium]|nr:hypothetical protein [Kiritimatiellia bacterium]HMP00047.1 hypothetical protein [Kiritimatiellia bacterium]
MLVAIMFRTSSVVLPVMLMVLVAVGLLFPIVDFIQMRKKARRDGELPPGLTVLVQEISRSQLLAVFLFITGMLSALIGLLALVTRDRMDTPVVIQVILFLAVGGGLVFISQIMLRRFRGWAGSWRIPSRKR